MVAYIANCTACALENVAGERKQRKHDEIK